MNFVFLDLNFLNTSYINFLKNLSFYVFTIFAICVFLLLFTNAIIRSKIIKDLLYFIIAIIACIGILLFCILFSGYILFPASYLSAIIKDLLVTKYLYNSIIITSFKELVINIVSLLIGVSIYSFILGKTIQIFIDQNTEECSVES